jgi:hypothetical protein
VRVVSGTVPPLADNGGQARLITARPQTTPHQITAPHHVTGDLPAHKRIPPFGAGADSMPVMANAAPIWTFCA